MTEQHRLTETQRVAVNTRFWYLGFRPRDRAERLSVCAVLLGLDSLASTKDLTPGQAGQLVRVLGEFRTSAQLQAAVDARADPGGQRRVTKEEGAMAGGKMSEAELNRVIRGRCDQIGLHAFSATTYRIPGASRRTGSSRGFVDWFIVGPGGGLFRESKSEDGRRSLAQIRWGKALTDAGFDYAVWQPCDLASGRIDRELRAVAEHPASSAV